MIATLSLRACVLATLFASSLPAADTLHLRISSETAPAGGVVQIKLFVTAPQPVASGTIVFLRDSALFGDGAVSGATVFSETADAYGSWFAYPCRCLGIQRGDLVAHFVSPSAGVGRSIDLPVFEATVSVAAGSHTVMLDLSQSFFKDPHGATYALDVQPGIVTVGDGSLSVAGVTPGGGIVPAGYVMQVDGAGFTPSTAVEIDGVESKPEFVNPTLINLTIAAPADMAGRRVRVRNPNGAPVDYWPWLHDSPEPLADAADTECARGCGIIFPANTAAAASWGGPLVNPRPNTGYGLALQNPTSVPVEVTITGAATTRGRGTLTASVPAWGSRNLPISNPPNVTVQSNPPSPVRMLAYQYTPSNSSGSMMVYPVIGLANAARGFVDSIVPEAVAPGEIVSIYGLNLGAQSLDGTRVLFDGVPAPLLYVSASQINAIVPDEVSGEQVTAVQVEYNGETNAAWRVPVVDAAPEIFQPVLNQDGSLNSPSNPATAGSVIRIFATGQGLTQAPVAVAIGGIDAEVESAISAPDAIAGLLEVSVRVPPGLAAGRSARIVLTVGSASSRGLITISIS